MPRSDILCDYLEGMYRTVSGGVIIYLIVGKMWLCLYQKLVNPVTSALSIIDRHLIFSSESFGNTYHSIFEVKRGPASVNRSQQVTGFVEANLVRSEYTLSTFLDIKGAFDNATTSSIENSLRDIHAPIVDGWSIVKRATRRG